jgi:cob(I)alamin adenosyltransferase
VKIYTKTGDTGQTSLLGGVRVSKADPRVDAYGAVDEANAAIGVARAAGVPSDIDSALEWIQRDLFALGASLADARGRARGEDQTIRPAGRVKQDSKMQLAEADIARLEAWIDEGEKSLPALRRFILPGGTPAGSALHMARTITRRAERRIVALGDVDPLQIIYINRLSDLLFVIARVTNHRAGVFEAEW